MDHLLANMKLVNNLICEVIVPCWFRRSTQRSAVLLIFCPAKIFRDAGIRIVMPWAKGGYSDHETSTFHKAHAGVGK
jgi:hypothetical protein